MRRAKPISVRVKAPSRGLVTRLPGEVADLLPATGGLVQSSIFLPSSMRRASAVASNVRYEDGVVAAAPGYQTIELDATILSGLIAQWNLDEVDGNRADASGNGHTLILVQGLDTLTGQVLSVTFEIGIFNNAALFNSMAFQAVVEDSFVADAKLGSGFINPLSMHFSKPEDNISLDISLSGQSFYSPRMGATKDHYDLDVSLGSGTYAETIGNITNPEDKFTMNAALSSGSYVSVIVPDNAPEDKFLMDVSLNSGVYFDAAVPNNAPEDKFLMDVALHSGTHTQTVFNPGNDEDKFVLNTTLASGSYS